MGEGGGAVAVTLTQPFWLGRTEVTRGQWQKLMGLRPGELSVAEPDSGLPAVGISWFSAVEFCQRLTQWERKSGILKSGEKYRLPTEAEWEYACRAGTNTVFSFGDDESRLGEFAWFLGNNRGSPQTVATKQPNSWGLYDMHGNVFEWCADWHGGKLAGGRNPVGPQRGSTRVNRGGAWDSDPVYLRSFGRPNSFPTATDSYLGFRLTLSKAAN